MLLTHHIAHCNCHFIRYCRLRITLLFRTFHVVNIFNNNRGTCRDFLIIVFSFYSKLLPSIRVQLIWNILYLRLNKRFEAACSMVFFHSLNYHPLSLSVKLGNTLHIFFCLLDYLFCTISWHITSHFVCCCINLRYILLESSFYFKISSYICWIIIHFLVTTIQFNFKHPGYFDML